MVLLSDLSGLLEAVLTQCALVDKPLEAAQEFRDKVREMGG